MIFLGSPINHFPHSLSNGPVHSAQLTMSTIWIIRWFLGFLYHSKCPMWLIEFLFLDSFLKTVSSHCFQYCCFCICRSDRIEIQIYIATYVAESYGHNCCLSFLHLLITLGLWHLIRISLQRKLEWHLFDIRVEIFLVSIPSTSFSAVH